MTMAADTLKALTAPFPPEKVSWRVGSTTADKKRGMALAYIDARDVMQRLDDVLGPLNWQCRYTHAGTITICEIGCGVSIDGKTEWVWKANGAGSTDVEAEKGACSDAFKRAAVLWGVGRYLYDLDSPWVALNGRQIAPEELPKLRALLEGKKTPDTKGKKDSRVAFSAIQTVLQSFQNPDLESSVASLQDYWKEPEVQEALLSMPVDWRDKLIALKNEAREYLSA
jgi:hypothetical protein